MKCSISYPNSKLISYRKYKLFNFSCFPGKLYLFFLTKVCACVWSEPKLKQRDYLCHVINHVNVWRRVWWSYFIFLWKQFLLILFAFVVSGYMWMLELCSRFVIFISLRDKQKHQRQWQLGVKRVRKRNRWLEEKKHNENATNEFQTFYVKENPKAAMYLDIKILYIWKQQFYQFRNKKISTRFASAVKT